MNRLLPIALAFALGAGAVSLVAQGPTASSSWLLASDAGCEQNLIPAMVTPVRYPLPAYAAGLGAFRQ